MRCPEAQARVDNGEAYYSVVAVLGPPQSTAIPPLGIGPLIVDGPFKPIVFGYLAGGLALLTLLFNEHPVRSRPGRALRALATSEAGALAAGVPVGRYKLQVFALSAAYAGLAGGVYAVST